MSYNIDALRLFNEKAEKLANCRFIKIVFGQKTGVELRGERGKPLEVIRRGPDDESIDSFVLTFRFFIQDNEKSSFRNIAKIYQALPISEEIKHRFSKARDVLNNFLESPPPIRYNIDNEVPNNRRILEVFVYGGLAHANPEKKKTYDRWTRNPETRALLINAFVTILATIMRIIEYVTQLNNEGIEFIKNETKI
jgi:hypothetical protein